MPTSSSTSAERRWITSRDRSPWARITSSYWSASCLTGLRAFIALCMTTEKSRHLVAASSFAVMVTRSRPWNSTLPRAIRAGGLSSWAIPKSIVDLPHPDSPTTPTNSPACTSRENESTARTGPPGVSYSTVRSRTSSRGTSGTGTLRTGSPDRSKGGDADLVEGVVEQRERGAQERDAEAGCDHPERLPGVEGRAALRPVQHGAPAQPVLVAEAD